MFLRKDFKHGNVILTRDDFCDMLKAFLGFPGLEHLATKEIGRLFAVMG